MSRENVPQIGINAQLLSAQAGYRQAGIHHYIAGLLHHLPARDGLAYKVFASAAAASLLANPALTVAPSRWPTGHRLARIAWEQAALPLLVRRHRLALLHSLAFVSPFWHRCPSVVTVYDLSFFHYPDRFPPWQRLYLKTQTRRSCLAARRVVAISAAGAADVQRLLGIRPDRIDVVYPGLDPQFRPMSATELDRFRRANGLPAQFILHVGTLQPRKNIPTLIEAVSRLGRPDVPLILVGGRGWLHDEIDARIEALSLQGQVRFAGYVADADLPLWYNAATLLVFPSVYEGFGMPVIQAMGCGTPVIASNVSAIPEAAGTAALTFAPTDIATLTDHMATVLEQPDRRAMMRDAGLKHAGQFQWARSSEALLSVYERALAAT